MEKVKISFRKIRLVNRWRRPKYARPCIGISLIGVLIWLDFKWIGKCKTKNIINIKD